MRQPFLQIHRAVGNAFCTPIHLPVYFHRSHALGRIPAKPLLQRSGGQHRLKHRAHAELRRSTVDQACVGCRNAGGNVLRVILRHAYAGKHLCGGTFQHQNAPPLHSAYGNALARALNGFVQRGDNALSAARRNSFHRLQPVHQAPACGNGTLHPVLIPRPGQQFVIGGLQAGHTAAFAVQIADQMLGHRNAHRPAARLIAANARRNIFLRQLCQKR